MATYELEALLAPVSDAAPSGENLEYDPAFLALERAATARSERRIGDSVKPAEEPDWSRVAEAALEMMNRSKDLRVAMHLVAAWTRLEGLPGWSTGLALIRGMLERHWATVHPQLDPEDSLDPTLRVNSLASLSDPAGLLGHLRSAPLVQSPRLGRFSLRDLRIANGSLKPAAPASAEAEPPSLAAIEACAAECTLELLTDHASAAAQALEHASAIETFFDDRIGATGPQLKPLLADIRELKAFLEKQLALRAAQTKGPDAARSDAASGTTTAVAASGRLLTPRDVMRNLDDICAYYACTEPSSPVPLLLRRAQRLIGKSFPDLLKDLAPAGLSEWQAVAGPGSDGE